MFTCLAHVECHQYGTVYGCVTCAQQHVYRKFCWLCLNLTVFEMHISDMETMKYENQVIQPLAANGFVEAP